MGRDFYSLFPAGPPRRMEASMNSFAGLVAVVAGLVFILYSTPSWGITPSCQPPECNSTASDTNANTGGGTSALVLVDSPGSVGYGNTAFGPSTLAHTTSGNYHTATGADALSVNTGSYNTATGASSLNYNQNGSYNTATGFDALYVNGGSKN